MHRLCTGRHRHAQADVFCIRYLLDLGEVIDSIVFTLYRVFVHDPAGISAQRSGPSGSTQFVAIWSVAKWTQAFGLNHIDKVLES